MEPSIERLQLTEDDEYTAILAEWKTKSDKFLEGKARESMKGHSQAEANRAKYRLELQKKQLEERKVQRAKLAEARAAKTAKMVDDLKKENWAEELVGKAKARLEEVKAEKVA